MRSDAADVGPELVERIRAGDPDAFEQAFRRLYPGLLRFARVQLAGGPDAEDVVHEVFLRVWRDRARLEPDRSLRNYLLTAVRNRALDVARHRAVARRTATLEREDAQTAWPADPAEVSELETAIRACVAALPERCRTAFLLCRQQELTYAEAAAVMGVRTATVKTQVARALAALRAAIEPFLGILLALTTLLR